MAPVEVMRFHDAPDLRRVFAQAVVNSRRGGPDVPEVVAERRGVVVDPSAVVDYAHVCGFTVGAALPTTYSHVLGFPLQAAVMARADFPMPLVGLVHIENRLNWSRPFAFGEALDVRVHATGLRPHRRGRLVDLVTEVRGTAPAGSAVAAGSAPDWVGVSTYLHRGGGDAAAPSEAEPDASWLRDRDGPTWRFAEGDGRRYAGVSGDVNPIHLHALTAKAFGFPKAIAHGMYTYARVLGALGSRVPAAGTSSVWFRKPVLLPSSALLHVGTHAGQDGSDETLAALFPAKGDGEHLVATVAQPGGG